MAEILSLPANQLCFHLLWQIPEAKEALESKDAVCYPTWFEISTLTPTFINASHLGRGWQTGFQPCTQIREPGEENLLCGTKTLARGESCSLCVAKGLSGLVLERGSIKLHAIIHLFTCVIL